MKRVYKKRKKSNLFLLVILVLTVSIGYALLSANLKITGIAGIKKNTWDIHWDDTSIVETQGSVTATTPAYVTDAKKENISFAVDLGLPREFYEFTVDARNYGTIDAVLEKVDIKFYKEDGVTPTTLSNCLQYSFTHADGSPYIPNESIGVGKAIKYRFRIEFKDVDSLDCTAAPPIIDITPKFVQPTQSQYKIIFNPNGGSISHDMKYIQKGEAVGELPTTTKDEVDFAGWYTGLTDGNKIKETTKPTGNTTYYAHWKEVLPIFDIGENVNVKFKTLAEDTLNETNPYTTNDTNITAIRKSSTEPTAENKTEEHIVSAENSPSPIYAWFDNGTIYWWTNANSAYLNEDSSSMFTHFKNLSTIELDSMNSMNVTNMTGMFASSNYDSLDFSTFDTSNVTTMNSTFASSTISTLDLSSFDTSSVTDMSTMFAGSNIQTLNLTSFDTSNVTTMSTMFASSKTTTLNLSNFDTGNVTNLSSMFSGSSAQVLDLSNFDTSKVTNFQSIFSGSVATSIDVSGWDFRGTNSLSGMFSGLSNLETINFEDVNTTGVLYLSGMFSGDSKLKSLDLSSFDVSSVTSFGMFGGNSSLKSINISNWDFASVTGISGFFSGLSSVEEIILENVNTSNIQYMSGMFSGDSSLKTLDLTSFNTSNTTAMDYMFAGCSSLTTITVSDDYVVGQVTSSGNMFGGCTSLVGGAGTPWDSNYIDKTRAHYDSGDFNPGYFNMAPGLDTYTVTFNPNGGTVDPTSKTVISGTRINTLPTPTLEGKLFKGWYTGLTDGIEVTERKVVTEDITLYAHWYTEKEITYDANGGKFSNDETTKEINYEYKSIPITKYSHTANINDQGVASGTYAYNLQTTDVVTIPGATTINVEVWYSTETYNYYDWLAIYPAGVTPTYYNYNQATVSNGKLYGGQYTSKPGDSTTYHKTYTVQGDTVQFYFQSNGSNSYYGYYAIITGVGYDYDKSDTYQQPTKENNKFAGWNTKADGTGKSYSSEQEILEKFDDFDDEDTLYAQWIEVCTVTFNPNDGTLEWNATVNYDKGDKLGYLPKARKTDYSLDGWYTELDGGIKVDINYIVDHTQTLYAHWNEVEAKFDTGVNVNNKFKILAGDEVTATYPYSGSGPTNSTILAIRRATTAPDITTLTADENIVSDPTSGVPIYAWFDDTNSTIYWWSEASTVYLNEDASYMFSLFNNLADIDTNFDTSLTENMYYMFGDCKSLLTIDVSGFNTHRVTNMGYMFYTGSAMKSIDLSNFDTSNCSNMYSVVGYMSSLEEVNMSNWDFTRYNPSDGDLMSKLSSGGFGSLKKIKFDNAILPTNLYKFGAYNSSVEEISLRNADASNSTTMGYMFYYSRNLKKIDLTGIDTSNVTTMDHMFAECYALESIDVSSFNTKNVANMNSMFYECKELVTLDVSNFNTKKVTNFNYFVGSCNKLKELNISNFDVSKAYKSDSSDRMYNMFYSSNNIKILIADNLKFGDTAYMAFYDLDHAEVISLKNVDTSKVKNMYYMFEDCESVKLLDLSSFDTSQVTEMYGMFYNAKSLKTILVSDDFVVNQVTSSSSMFYNCNVLEGGHGTQWDSNIIDKTRAHYDYGSIKPGYFNKRDAEREYYTVTFNPNGGKITETTRKVLKGESIGYLPTATKENSTFEGWRLDIQVGTIIDENYIPTSDITLTATWTELGKYTITFDPDGGTVTPQEKYVTEGEPIGLLPTAKKPDKIFDYWYYETEDNVIDSTYVPDGNMILKAKYREPRVFTITLNANGGEVDPTSVEVIEGHAIGELPTAVWTKHHSTGWYTGLTDGIKINSTYTPTGDITIYTHWLNIYTVTFDPNGGTCSEFSRDIIEGQKIGPLPTATKDHSIHLGWKYGTTDGIYATANDIPTSDITLTADWQSAYIVTFDPNTGRVDEEQRYVPVGDPVGDLPTAIKDGYYKFDDWTLNDTKVDYSYTPTGDVTLIANYSTYSPPSNNCRAGEECEDDWSTIDGEIQKAPDNLCSIYPVGTLKTVDMGRYGTHTIRVSNCTELSSCSNKNYSQTACGVVWEFADIITVFPMKTQSDYAWVGGWPATDMRRFVNEEIYNALPSDLKDNITITRVYSGHGPVIEGREHLDEDEDFLSYDKLYLLSPMEVFGSRNSAWANNADSSYLRTKQLDYYAQRYVSSDNPGTAAQKRYAGNPDDLTDLMDSYNYSLGYTNCEGQTEADCCKTPVDGTDGLCSSNFFNHWYLRSPSNAVNWNNPNKPVYDGQYMHVTCSGDWSGGAYAPTWHFGVSPAFRLK